MSLQTFFHSLLPSREAKREAGGPAGSAPQAHAPQAPVSKSPAPQSPVPPARAPKPKRKAGGSAGEGAASGGHTWDDTGFGLLLVDMLLRPGGILVLDDMNWSVKSSAYYRSNPKLTARYSPDEAATPTVRRTWDTILPHLGYERLEERREIAWGIARKTR